MVSNRVVSHCFYSAALLLAGPVLGGTSAAQKVDPLAKWESFDYVHSRITADQLKDLSLTQLKYMRGIVFGKQVTPITAELLHGLSLRELRLLRNEVYARRGKRFRTKWIQRYFDAEDWYRPHKDFGEPALSPIEAKNVATIVLAENSLHDSLNTKPLDAAMLTNMFLEDARKLREEIYARRGKIFEDHWTDDYFRSFKWYKPDPEFAAKSLSTLEKRNVATLLAYEKNARREGAITGA